MESYDWTMDRLTNYNQLQQINSHPSDKSNHSTDLINSYQQQQRCLYLEIKCKDIFKTSLSTLFSLFLMLFVDFKYFIIFVNEYYGFIRFFKQKKIFYVF